MLNNQEPTHLNISTGETSTIDLIIVSNTLISELELLTLEDTHNSDHYPLIIHLPNNHTSYSHSPASRYKFKTADWSLYNSLINLEQESADINADVVLFNQTITNAAEQAIPKTVRSSKRNNVPWWNNEIAKTIHQRKIALRKLIKTKTLPSLIEYKRLRAKAKRTIKIAKKSTWK